MSDLLIKISILIIGIFIGLILHKVFGRSSKKIRELENQIKTKDQEHKLLQNNLDNYFSDANSLATKLAEEYQTLISKISEGTRKFSSLSKTVYYPAITNNLSNPGIKDNIPYTVDSLNKSENIALYDNKAEKEVI